MCSGAFCRRVLQAEGSAVRAGRCSECDRWAAASVLLGNLLEMPILDAHARHAAPDTRGPGPAVSLSQGLRAVLVDADIRENLSELGLSPGHGAGAEGRTYPRGPGLAR